MHLAVSLVCFVVSVPPFGTPRSLFISISPPFDPYISIVSSASSFASHVTFFNASASCYLLLLLRFPLSQLPPPFAPFQLFLSITVRFTHIFLLHFFIRLPGFSSSICPGRSVYSLYAYGLSLLGASRISRFFEITALTGKEYGVPSYFARNNVVSSVETCSTVKDQNGSCLLAKYYFYTTDRCCPKIVEFENLILCTLNICTMSTTSTYFRSENVERKFNQ